MEKTFEYNLVGHPFKVVIGKVVKQANGECLVYYGDTAVLVTATVSKEAKDEIDLFPLSVDHEEKMYAAEKSPEGLTKREGRPSEKVTLTARLINRSIRPLFPEGSRNSVRMTAIVFSVGQDCLPEVMVMIGSSIALSTSSIPFKGPTASVHVGYIDGNHVISPDVEQRAKSKIDLTVSGTKGATMMVETGSDIVSEDEVLGVISFAHKEIKKICQFIDGITAEFGQEKVTYTVAEPNQEIYNKIYTFANEFLTDVIHQETRTGREEAQEAAKEKIYTEFKDDLEKYGKNINEVIDEIIRKEIRVGILNDRRSDNRATDEIRPLSAKVGIFPRTHGSGLLKRGQTQVLSVATLAGLSEVQIIDGLGDDTPRRYIHHYNSPSYYVGDIRPMRSPGWGEIGYGVLAERALIPALPTEDEFPYIIRAVSEVLSFNGSSSQASICESTLFLMDAGVPIKAPVVEIAMGLIKEGQDIKALTDIQGLGDHLGDMDFKVAGTKEGTTALQMDIKIDEINKEILEEALLKAKKARMTTLETSAGVIDKPREDLSPYVPLIYTVKVKSEKIGEVIGSGGKAVNSIIEETNVKTDIEDDGRVSILSQDKDCALTAINRIEEIVKDVEVGEVYKDKVKKIVKFGVFVEVSKGREELFHISNISRDHVKNVEDVLKEDQEVEVKVIGIDQQGKISLSRKELLKDSKDQSKYQ